MLASDAVYRFLNTPDTSIICDAYVPESRRLTLSEIESINSDFDAYVLPLSNALRPGFSRALENLTYVIERLNIPVIVPCVGGNVLPGSEGQLREGVRDIAYRFVRAVLDHSSSVGVRGDITRTALLKLGFHDDEIVVVGTPALYDTQDDSALEKTDSIDAESLLTIDLNSDIEGMGTFYTENERRYPTISTVFQTVAGANLLLWGMEARSFPEGIPRTVRSAAYVENRLRLFTNPKPWKEYLKERDFVFGPRIHGAVAALAVGTPAYVLTVDSRTKEIAEYHSIPNKPFHEALASGSFLAGDLYEEADYAAFNSQKSQSKENFLTFLTANGLHHIDEPGQENKDYQLLLDRFMPAPAVTPLTPDDPSALAQRLNWLRQDRDFDHWRPFGAFRPETSLYRGKVESPQKAITQLCRRDEIVTHQLSAQRHEIVALARRIERLQTSNEQYRRDIGELRATEARIDHDVKGLEGNILIRLTRKIKRMIKRG
ncbi:MAG: polysaccharide pyruvyl transferase family protein [Bifidobacteriaceae bacterium]|jgi:hypothetical protein|nr:polysaccharide pyruvyl transferase family protein [Bifidobacteriaceae bacterium]MCI1915206.1 polysaccharide pyruvyl transferase family protein [Bifidobacteriaceae bacterium]